MKKSRFSEEKIIAALKQAEAGVKVSEVVRKLGVAEVTLPRFHVHQTFAALRLRSKSAGD